MRLTRLFTKNKTTVGLNSVYRRTSGFTIVEILVVITVSALLASPVIFSLGGFYEDNLTSVTLSAQDTEVKNALATISNDLKKTTGFRASLTIPTATPQPPLGSSSNATAGGNWSYCGTTTILTTCDDVTTNTNYLSKRALIAYVDATDGPTTSTTYNPVFLNSGAFNLSTATRATNAYIYFVAPDRANSSINNLYRRTIVNVDPTNNTDWSNALYDCSVQIGQNPSSTNCVTPTPSLDTKNSCASTVVSSNTSFCASSDAVLLKNVESFWVDYYYSNNQKISDVYTSSATTAATVVTNIKNSAQSVQVTITKKLSGSPAKRSSASTRIVNNSTTTPAAVTPPSYRASTLYWGPAYDASSYAGYTSMAMPTHSAGDILLVFLSGFTGYYGGIPANAAPAAGGTVPAWNEIPGGTSGGRMWWARATAANHTSGSWYTMEGWVQYIVSISGAVTAGSPIGGAARSEATYIAPAITLTNADGSSLVLTLHRLQNSGAGVAPTMSNPPTGYTLLAGGTWVSPNTMRHAYGIIRKDDSTSAGSYTFGSSNFELSAGTVFQVEVKSK